MGGVEGDSESFWGAASGRVFIHAFPRRQGQDKVPDGGATEEGGGARQASCLAGVCSSPPAAAPSSADWKMKAWACTAVMDQNFWVNTAPPPPGGRSCRPPKFNSGEEMEVWWMEWSLGLPNENNGDGPLAWRTRSHWARQAAWVQRGA